VTKSITRYTRGSKGHKEIIKLFFQYLVPVVAVIFSFSSPIGCQPPNKPFPPVDSSKISRIEAALDTREREIDRFEIRSEDFPRVLKLFEGGTLDPQPSTWVYAGNIWIEYKDGRTCGVALFRTFQATGAYKADGRYYRGSTDDEIIRTIVECHDRSKAVSP